jgi:hypothetical protein
VELGIPTRGQGRAVAHLQKSEGKVKKESLDRFEKALQGHWTEWNYFVLLAVVSLAVIMLTAAVVVSGICQFQEGIIE